MTRPLAVRAKSHRESGPVPPVTPPARFLGISAVQIKVGLRYGLRTA
jgi:hypothetical protein